MAIVYRYEIECEREDNVFCDGANINYLFDITKFISKILQCQIDIH